MGGQQESNTQFTLKPNPPELSFLGRTEEKFPKRSGWPLLGEAPFFCVWSFYLGRLGCGVAICTAVRHSSIRGSNPLAFWPERKFRSSIPQLKKNKEARRAGDDRFALKAPVSFYLYVCLLLCLRYRLCFASWRIWFRYIYFFR